MTVVFSSFIIEKPQILILEPGWKMQKSVLKMKN